jgi:uncharacterized protein YndB with AHSA1/START domain
LPTASRSRTITASVEELWELVRDPHHLPRWWPRVERVEDVEDDAFTEVMRTAKGKVVRADFNFLASEQTARSITWSQRLVGTPFARLLSSSETEVRLAPVTVAAPRPSAPGDEKRSGARTEVTIELRQVLTGFFPRFGGFMVRRAAAATLEEALDGLERISG